jgi:hypothetical protein
MREGRFRPGQPEPVPRGNGERTAMNGDME